VLFLEDAFGESHAEQLKQAGYPGVERFAKWFKDERTRRTQQSVKDPEIIRFCDSQKWMLVTTDSDMQFTHVEEIKKTEIAILATAHNKGIDPGEWVAALITGKARILRFFSNHPRPSFATFNRQGQLTTVKTINPERYTRRNRPRETESKAS
jgi:hypothetical protein